MKTPASARARSSFVEAATSPAPSLTISRACDGPPMHATRASPKRSRRRIVGASPCGGVSPFASEMTALRWVRPAFVSPAIVSPTPVDGTPRKTKSARPTPASTLSIRSSFGRSTPGRYTWFWRSSSSVLACSGVRVCSVVRKPPRARSTATAVPNDPAPTTIARRVGSERLGRERTSGTARAYGTPARWDHPRVAALLLRHADPDRDSADCAAIYAPNVEASVTSFEVVAPDAEQFAARITATMRTHPWVVLEDDGRVAGYAYASQHRARAAYRWAADVGIYVDPGYQGRGAGRRLYEGLFALMRAQSYRVACAGVTLPNAASVGLHRALGFEEVGVYRAIGYKNGAWHDVVWMQLTLNDGGGTPAEPRVPWWAPGEPV